MKLNRRHITGILLLFILMFTVACGAQRASDGSSAYGGPGKVSEAFDSANDSTENESREMGMTEEASQDPSPGGSGDTAASDSTYELPAYGEYYYDLENVVLYLEVYDELPPNYITKAEARSLGWNGGSVEEYQEGAAIGGDVFGNREGLLPEEKGRSYTECDIDTDGYGSRGSRRLVFSDDGLYFYTADHYETFSEVFVTDDYEVIR